MDDFLKKELGIWILLVTSFFGAVVLYYLEIVDWSLVWIWFVGVTWYATEVLIAAFVWHYFKAQKSDILQNTPTLTKIDSIPEVPVVIPEASEPKIIE